MRLFISFAAMLLISSVAITASLAMKWERQQDAFSANDPEQARTDVFTRLDANADGVLTEVDATTDARTKFFQQLRQAADADGDGRVTRAEYLAVQRLSLTDEGGQTEQHPISAAFLFVLDVDRDGALSAAEIAIAPERLQTLDANADGAVSAEELHSAGLKAVEALANEDRAEREIAVLFAEFDKNEDGQIELEEASPLMRQAFKQLDVDSSGTISLEEFGHAIRNADRKEVSLTHGRRIDQ